MNSFFETVRVIFVKVLFHLFAEYAERKFLTDGTFFLRNASGWFPKSPAVWETDDKTAGEQA